jgi:hypothetical protein
VSRLDHLVAIFVFALALADADALLCFAVLYLALP